jgi:hypothetical protein
MFVLRRADHQHFADDVEGSHEALRAMTLPGEAAWMTAAMLPVSQLCPGEHGYTLARGLSLAHLDAVLRGNDVAERFLADSGPNRADSRELRMDITVNMDITVYTAASGSTSVPARSGGLPRPACSNKVRPNMKLPNAHDRPKLATSPAEKARSANSARSTSS